MSSYVNVFAVRIYINVNVAHPHILHDLYFEEKLIYIFFPLLLGKFWQITDIHWDQKYSEDGDSAKMCHKAYQSDGHNSKWGNYNCDSPWPLVKSAIQAMVEIEAQPDFVLWTG